MSRQNWMWNCCKIPDISSCLKSHFLEQIGIKCHRWQTCWWDGQDYWHPVVLFMLQTQAWKISWSEADSVCWSPLWLGIFACSCDSFDSFWLVSLASIKADSFLAYWCRKERETLLLKGKGLVEWVKKRSWNRERGKFTHYVFGLWESFFSLILKISLKCISRGGRGKWGEKLRGSSKMHLICMPFLLSWETECSDHSKLLQIILISHLLSLQALGHKMGQNYSVPSFNLDSLILERYHVVSTSVDIVLMKANHLIWKNKG